MEPQRAVACCMGWLRLVGSLKGISLFLQKRQYSAKETYNLKEPTNRSHTVAPPNPVVARVILCMLSCPPVSHKSSHFIQRHHALDAHTPSFHSTAISRFPIFRNKKFGVFGSYLFTFSKVIFFILVGWPNFFAAGVKGVDLCMWIKKKNKV